MKPVFEYIDYRELLKEAYDERKAALPLFSYRMMAESLEIDGSYLFRILQKELHLPARCLPRAVELLKLTGRSAEYFQLMVAYARERKASARSDILEKALNLRDVERFHLDGGTLPFFRDWWVVAVRCLLEVLDGRANPREISERLQPPVSEAQAMEALDLLQNLGLVKKADSGRLVPAQVHLTADGEDRRMAVQEFQKKILALAGESVDRFSRDRRDISTLSLAVDGLAFSEIREMLRECRRQIQKRVEETRHPDRVMQLAMAFFPLAPELEKR